MLIDPPTPLDASPDLKITDPLLPEELLPEDKNTDPETPECPLEAVLKVNDPLDENSENPDMIETEPPV
jgi:hypothetical protein